jgi:hypothetical protein
MATTLATLIAQMEGWLVSGSLAQINNNPGNLRYVGQAGATGSYKGYATFSTPEAGWAALERQLQLDAASGDTLQKFINEYAPPSENDTSNYLQYLVSGLGVSASTPLSQILGQSQSAPIDTTETVPTSYDLASMIPDLSGVSNWVWLGAVAGVGLLLYLKRD